jgi:hypothetical protein
MTAAATPRLVGEAAAETQLSCEATTRRRPPLGAVLLPIFWLVAITAVVAVIFWPGHMDLDGLDEYNQAQTGHYNDYHTPTLEFLWRGMYRLGLHSPGWVLAAGVLTLVAGIYLLMRGRLSRFWALAATTAVLAFPPVLGWAVQVGRDEWFTAFVVLGFGLVVRAGRSEGWSRRAALAGVVPIAFLADAARQNAIPATVVLLAAAALLALRGRSTARRRGLAAAAAGVVAASLVFAAQFAFVYGPLHTVAAHPEQNLYIYDLASMSRLENRVLLPADVYPKQDIHYLDAWTNPINPDAIIWGPYAAVDWPLTGSRFDHLAAAWRSAVRAHPGDYLRARASLSARMLALNIPARNVYQFPPQPPRSALNNQFPGAHDEVMQYVSADTSLEGGTVLGGALYRVWAYVVLLVVADVWLIARRRPLDIAVILCGAAALFYMVVLFVAATSVGWRLMFPVVVVAVVVTVLAAVDVVATITSRRRTHARP